MSEIAAAYDRWSAQYDVDRNLTRDLAGHVLRRQGLERSGRDILEVGCGTGLNTAWLLEGARRVVAMDFSEGMLGQARSRLQDPRLELVRHDLRDRWPVPDGSVDLAVDSLVLEHIEALEPIFREAARVLRPGGTLFMVELHPTRQLHGRQAEFQEPGSGEPVRVEAFVHDVSDYVNAGLQAGLELVRMGEWRDGEEPSARTLPRLLSVQFLRR